MSDLDCDGLQEYFDRDWRVAIADLLKRLLVTTRAYRAKWLPHRRRPSNVDPPVSAVARVIAARLREEGEEGSDEELFKRAKTLVKKAFDGKQFTRRTLDLFIKGFVMDERPEDVRRLEWMWDRQFMPAAQGELGIVWTALAEQSPEILTARRYQRTVQLTEEHVVGPDHKPVRHRTRQVIEAMVGGLDRHLFLHDAQDAAITVDEGGVAGRTLRLSPSLIGLEILYDAPLAAGETHTLVYESCFDYAEPPSPHFRRAALRQVEAMSIVVRFDPAAVPRRVWWCSWKSLEQPPTERHEVQLRDNLSVEHFLASALGQIVGFEWEWD